MSINTNNDLTVNFWSPIEYLNINKGVPKNFACKIFEAAEAYLSPTLKGRIIVNIKIQPVVGPLRSKSHWAKTALKVASYFTVILPAIALIIKCTMRYAKFGALRPNADQLIKAQMFKPLT